MTANEQTNSNEYIAQTVAKAARVAKQILSVTGAARTENAGPKMSGPIMKQPTLYWSSEDRYDELRNFKLKVNKTCSKL